METDTLLKHLDHQLKWLQEQKYSYLNLAPLSAEERLKLQRGLQSMMGSLNPSPVSPPPGPAASSNLHASSAIPSLQALQEQYCTCQRCPLGATRTNFVFGVGNPQTPLLFIGEGPGADEDRLGEPFVGRAGKLLTKMIQSIGIDRRDVYISNVVKCRPPNNRNPHAEEIAKCFPILKQQFELINPQLIVTLGNVPTRALVPDAPGITRSRGQLFHYQHWKVLPTFHPAYLLRNPSAMAQSWEDFKKIRHLCFETTPA